MKPSLPLPEPILNNVPGTWTYETATKRWPAIARRVLAENELEEEAIAALQQLIAEIETNGEIRPLRDNDDWNHYVTPHLGQRWLNSPNFFAEAYFYRRILEAIGYFVDDEFDPFADQKRRGLRTTRPVIRRLCQLVAQALQAPSAEALSQLILVDLWGNRADLSLFAADADEAHSMIDGNREQLLVDETLAVLAHLLDPSGLKALSGSQQSLKPERSARRIDFIIDNAGFELVCDLALAAYLLGSQTADSVHFHLKTHPTFVSDATKLDVAQTLSFLLSDGDREVEQMAAKLSVWWENGRLQLHDHPFWTSPLALWEMPADLRADLAQSHLIISKGDANDRRLLGDRHWPFTTPISAIMCYAPAHLLALRTLKAEVASGLTEAQVGQLNAKDARWMVNGRWGVIQFV
jgi:uncharacterized protein with ATP-grasp and redox domains